MRSNTKTNTPSQRRQAYKTLPTKVSLKDFNRYVKPHLSVGTRGPHTTLSAFQIFNYILEVLHTGMPWYRLKCPVHYVNIWRHHDRWSNDGSYRKLHAASVQWLADNDLLDLFALHGDGSNAVAKKGGLASATPATSTRRAKNSFP